MKKSIFIIALLSLSYAVMAQSDRAELEMIQSVFGMEKKAIVADFIQLEGAQADAFWKLYDEYEIERKELGKRRIALLETYAKNYPTLDDDTAEEILDEMISLQNSNDKFITTYTKKIKKEVGVKPAAQFLQIEVYLMSKIRTEILGSIPLIRDLENL